MWLQLDKAALRGVSASPLRLAPVDCRSHPAGDFVLPVVLFGAGNVGEFGEAGGHGRIEFALEQRQHYVTDSVACVMKIPVGGVFAPGLADLAKIGFEFVMADGEERANDFGATLVGFVG